MKRTAFISKDDSDVDIPLAEGYAASLNEKGESVWKKNIYYFPPIGTSDGGAYATVGDLDLRATRRSPYWRIKLATSGSCTGKQLSL